MIANKLKSMVLVHITTIIFWFVEAVIFCNFFYKLNYYILPIYTPIFVVAGVYTYLQYMRKKLLREIVRINSRLDIFLHISKKTLYFLTFEIIIDIYKIFIRKLLNVVKNRLIKLEDIFKDIAKDIVKIKHKKGGKNGKYGKKV